MRQSLNKAGSAESRAFRNPAVVSLAEQFFDAECRRAAEPARGEPQGARFAVLTYGNLYGMLSTWRNSE